MNPAAPTPPEAPENPESTVAYSTPRRQLALQFGAALAVLSLAWPYYGLRNEALPWPDTAFTIGAGALLLASLTHQPWWWRTMHALFAPLAWAVAQLSIDPGWFLLAFILLLLIYRGALSGQIPLYLSNRETATALGTLFTEQRGMRFLDLGAGLGSTLYPLTRVFPDRHFTGVENAPLTWLFGRLRLLGRANCRWRLDDIWHTDLSTYDLVYAFLSPAPMPDLWQKAVREMRPGSLFVSNTFPVPDLSFDEEIELHDLSHSRLLIRRM